MVKIKPNIVVIAHNLRSCHNIGSLFRTSEGLGITKLYLSGYSPYPLMEHDKRMPHIASKIQSQINKTALGAEKTLPWEYASDIKNLLDDLKSQGYILAALEQTKSSIDLTTWNAPDKVALILGRETEGVEPEVISQCDYAVEIPMYGQKESFNVVQAAAMALYKLTFCK